MAKGASSKANITNILRTIFKDSFMDGKTLRIPCTEDGEIVEIKVTLTAAKNVLGEAEPTQTVAAQKVDLSSFSIELTDEEKDLVDDYLKKLSGGE